MAKQEHSPHRPDDFEPLKGKKRTLSRFLANELLYDYATDNLDEHRRSSVAEFLRLNSATREELESLKEGMAFCDQLAETEISSELMYKLSQVRAWHSKALRLVHWRNWPEVTKWTLEALAISILVAFVAVIGWPKLTEMLPAPRPDMTLAQVEKEKDKVPLSPEEQMSSKEGSDSAAPNLFAANENQNSSTSEPKVESKPKESDESVKKDAEASAQSSKESRA